uniref:Uncharacterized protein n=1 Tax=Arundo donax TaxID=35708 RepID=A0A0A9AGG2_ARUDO
MVPLNHNGDCQHLWDKICVPPLPVLCMRIIHLQLRYAASIYAAFFGLQEKQR